MAQTAYQQNFNTGFAGMLSQAGANFEKVISKCIGSTSASIAGGFFACRDTTDDTIKLPGTSAAVTGTGVGFVIHDVAKEPKASDGGVLENVSGQMVGVMQFGTMLVNSEVAVAYGDPVFVRFTVNGGLTIGGVRNDADSGKAVALPGCRFIGTIAAAGLVEIERLPSN